MRKVPPISELKKTCAKPSERRMSFPKKIARLIAVCITKMLLYTPVTANQVTWFMMLFGVFASVFFYTGDYMHSILGVILLYVWVVLDHVDGQVARYRKTISYKGYFLDYIGGYITEPLVFLFLTFGVYAKFPYRITLLAGFLMVLSILIYPIIKNSRYSLLHCFSNRHKVKTGKTGATNKLLNLIIRLFEGDREKPTFIFNFFKIIHLMLIFSLFDKLYILFFAYSVLYPLRMVFVLIFQYVAGIDLFLAGIDK